MTGWYDVTLRRDAWNQALEASGHPSVVQSIGWSDFKAHDGAVVRRFLFSSGGGTRGFQAWRLSAMLPLYWSPEGGFPIAKWPEPSEGVRLGSVLPMIVAPLDERNLLARFRIRIPIRMSHPSNVVVDLTLGEDELLRRTHQKWRNALKGARKKASPAREVSIEEFIECDSKLRMEVEETKQFRSPWSSARLRQLAASGLALVAVASFDELGATACMLSVSSGKSAMMVSASAGSRGREQSSGYLTYWEMANLLRQKGAERWNLGGLDAAENEGVARFKSRGGGITLNLPGAFLVL